MLRTALLRLRDRYDAIDPAAGTAGIARDRRRICTRRTGRMAAPQLARVARAATGKKPRRRPAAAADVRGATGLPRTARRAWAAGWNCSPARNVARLDAVRRRSAVPFGDHPTFGHRHASLAWAGRGGQHCRVAFGPILGEGRSMPKDLEVKLSASDTAPAAGRTTGGALAAAARHDRSPAICPRPPARFGSSQRPASPCRCARCR